MNRIISFIIPTYNRSGSLKRTIESVIYQTSDNWELIIIDDGSTDGTRTLIKPYLSDQRITYHYQINQGVSAARNKGALLSQGDYLIFLDSDDFIESGLLTKLNLIDFFQYELITWPVIRKDKIETIIKPIKLKGLYNHLTVLFLAGSICYRKECFNKAGGFDTVLSFGENYELGIRISQLVKEVKILDEPYLIYNVDPEKRASNSISNRITSGIYQYKKHRDKYLLDPKSDSEMTYILGYLFEKIGKNKTAFRFYLYSWRVYPIYYKAFLKTVYFVLFKRFQCK